MFNSLSPSDVRRQPWQTVWTPDRPDGICQAVHIPLTWTSSNLFETQMELLKQLNEKGGLKENQQLTKIATLFRMQRDNVSSDILRTCASARMIGTCLKTYDELSTVELLLPSARRQ